jgi:hypothetical protein
VKTRKSAPFRRIVQERLAKMAEAHGRLPRPPKSGRLIGIPRR